MVVVTSLDDLRSGKRLQGEAIAMRAIDGPATIRNDDFDEVLYVLGEDKGIFLPRGQELGVDGTVIGVGVAQTGVSGLHQVRLEDAPIQKTGDRWYRELIRSEITQFVGSIPPGRAPDHFHLYEEVLCILKGSGFLWAGTSKTPIAPGSCVYLPKGQPHCVENTTSGELRLLGIFYPAGSPAMRYPVHERADRSPEEDELERRD